MPMAVFLLHQEMLLSMRSLLPRRLLLWGQLRNPPVPSLPEVFS